METADFCEFFTHCLPN